MSRSIGTLSAPTGDRVLTAERLRGAAPVGVLIGLCVVVELLAPGFASAGTLSVILSNTSTLFVMGTGVTFAILLGGIDLSIQAVASFASVVLAKLLPLIGPFAFPATVLLGIAFGSASGIVHVTLRVPSFIATLATGGVATGLALLVADGRTITITEDGRRFTGWMDGSVFHTPNVFLLSAAIGAITMAVLRFTRFGRYTVAVGAGEAASAAAGINVDRIKILAFATSGTLAAIAGIILASRLSSGSPSLANQLLLPAIASVIVGGTAITGGLGGIDRTAVGALIISVVQVGMTFIGVNIFAQQAVFGLMLIAAVAVTIDRSKIPIIK